jgi:hypothetical protein
MGSKPNGPVALLSARTMLADVASTAETVTARMLFSFINKNPWLELIIKGTVSVSGEDYSGAALRFDDRGVKNS